MLFLSVCHILEQAGVSYAVCGGYAVSLYGAVRGTVDVDILLGWTLENLQKAEKALLGLGLVSKLPINAKMIFENKDDYITNKNLIAWNFYNPKNPAEQVDVIITEDLKNKGCNEAYNIKRYYSSSFQKRSYCYETKKCAIARSRRHTIS
jgi:hypothetical protein